MLNVAFHVYLDNYVNNFEVLLFCSLFFNLQPFSLKAHFPLLFIVIRHLLTETKEFALWCGVGRFNVPKLPCCRI